MFYRDVRASQEVGTRIGRLYMEASPEITCMARRAYAAFARQTAEQYEDVSRAVNVIFQDDDPYESAEAMMEDVYRNRRLRIYRTRDGQDHPLLTRHENDQFRAVHDFNGHARAGVGFSRHGEEAAWQCHSRMYSGLARRAMTTETRGQNSAFIWLNDGKEFPPQKAVLLPAWVSELEGPFTS